MTQKSLFEKTALPQRLYLVAYLDLLNQRERIMETDCSIPKSNEEFEKLFTLTQETYGAIFNFRDRFRNMFFKYYNNLANSDVSPEMKEYFYREYLYADKKFGFDSFGDTVMFYIPIQDEDHAYHPLHIYVLPPIQ